MTTRYRNVSSDGLSTRSGILPPGGEASAGAFFPDSLASWIERGKLVAVHDASASVPPATGSLSPVADATDPPRRRARR